MAWPSISYVYNMQLQQSTDGTHWTNAYSCQVNTNPPSGVSLTGLSPNTTYSFRLVEQTVNADHDAYWLTSRSDVVTASTSPATEATVSVQRSCCRTRPSPARTQTRRTAILSSAARETTRLA